MKLWLRCAAAWWTACAGLLAASAVAGDHADAATAAAPSAPVPLVRLDEAPMRLNLASVLQRVRLPAATAPDPDLLWAQAASGETAPDRRWDLRGGELWVGRLTLAAGAAPQVRVVEVPSPQVDEVRIWTRTGGGPWQAALAGDRVALDRWVFANQFPAVPVLVAGTAPVDLLVAATNAAFLRVPVALVADAEFRETQVRRANLSGLILGLGGMFVIGCTAAALLVRRRAQVVLACVAAWVLLTIACNNGYMALWLTPGWPDFNDASKHFTGMVLAGLVVLLVSEVLDTAFLTSRERTLAFAAPALGLGYAVAQQLVLPMPVRILGAALAAFLSVGACVLLVAVNRWRGGRYTAWVGAAVACFFGTALLPFIAPDQVAGLDLRAAAVAASIYLALMLLRQALVLRDRYGRDVLSRAAISANRDPLTALWSWEGFQQRFAEATLREAAGQGRGSLLVFLLPGMERTGAEHGLVLSERALVRFAALLQRLLGPSWVIGRISKTRFAALSLHPLEASALVHTATNVLAECTRVTQPLALVADFDMRIVCRHRGLADKPLPELLRMMEEAGRSLGAGKRITLQ